MQPSGPDIFRYTGQTVSFDVLEMQVFSQAIHSFNSSALGPFGLYRLRPAQRGEDGRFVLGFPSDIPRVTLAICSIILAAYKFEQTGKFCQDRWL
jgi:hypothetical protein